MFLVSTHESNVDKSDGKLRLSKQKCPYIGCTGAKLRKVWQSAKKYGNYLLGKEKNGYPLSYHQRDRNAVFAQ